MDYSKYCSLTFNGQLLDQVLPGYLTVNVEGRGILERVINNIDIPGRDGTFILNQKIPVRELTVYFQIKGTNASDYLTKLTALHNALKTDGDVTIKFGDEAYYRKGRLSTADNPPYDYFIGIGSFTLICQDPYKYKDITNLVGTSITFPAGQIYPYLIKTITITTAATTGLTINNTTTGKKIVLTGSFTAGQTLIIKLQEWAITLNGQNIMNRLDFINSDWKEFEVKSGDVLTCTQSMTIALSERAL